MARGEHAGSLLMLPELGDSLATGDVIERVPSRITGYSSSMHADIVTGLSRGGENRILGCAVYGTQLLARAWPSRAEGAAIQAAPEASA